MKSFSSNILKFIGLLLFCFCSCSNPDLSGNDDGQEAEFSIIGKWKIIEGSLDSDGKFVKNPYNEESCWWLFREDGTLSYTNIEDTGTYKYDEENKVLTVAYDSDHGAYTDYYIFKWNKSEIYMKHGDDPSIIIKLVKLN